MGEVYFQCAKAMMRSELWADLNPPSDLPTAGDFISEMTNGREGGAQYDARYDKRARTQFWVREK